MRNIMYFRKRRHDFEGIRYDGTNIEDVKIFVGDGWRAKARKECDCEDKDCDCNEEYFDMIQKGDAGYELHAWGDSVDIDIGDIVLREVQDNGRPTGVVRVSKLATDDEEFFCTQAYFYEEYEEYDYAPFASKGENGSFSAFNKFI